jgi:hypothetical protein
LIAADISVMATKAAAETIFYWAITTDINYIVSFIILLKQITVGCGTYFQVRLNNHHSHMCLKMLYMYPIKILDSI